MRGEFQIIVTTDAGNEGIDLQAAHVLVNYDIPWSSVLLERRMGRIHRVGQHRDVYLYNLVATDAREGETLLRLLDNFVTARTSCAARCSTASRRSPKSPASTTTSGCRTSTATTS